MDRVNKANTFADFVLKYGKIGFYIVSLIIGVFLLYNQVQFNTTTDIRQDAQFHEVMEMMNREFELQSTRSDKRYTRAMDEAEELHEHNHEQDDKLWNLNERISFIEGQKSMEK